MFLLCLVVASLLGCGRAAPSVSEAEKQECKKTLLAALDAWQAGRLAELKSQSPPITFTDDDVVMGNTLISYDLDPALDIEPHADVQVRLILKDRSGQSIHRAATYQVMLTPNPSVLRNDP